jgi:hypothetical protein
MAQETDPSGEALSVDSETPRSSSFPGTSWKPSPPPAKLVVVGLDEEFDNEPDDPDERAFFFARLAEARRVSPLDEAIIARFWSLVGVTSGCWLWTGAASGDYGGFNYHGVQCLAHRFAYEITRGAISHGLVLDHLCRVKRCVRPDHLEAVENQENLRRARRHSERNQLCRNGHPFVGANVYLKSGRPLCRVCHSPRQAA